MIAIHFKCVHSANSQMLICTSPAAACSAIWSSLRNGARNVREPTSSSNVCTKEITSYLLLKIRMTWKRSKRGRSTTGSRLKRIWKARRGRGRTGYGINGQASVKRRRVSQLLECGKMLTPLDISGTMFLLNYYYKGNELIGNITKHCIVVRI